MTKAVAVPSARPGAPSDAPGAPPPEVAALLGHAAVPGRHRDTELVSLLLALVGVLGITSPYLPLGLALVEHLTLRTDRVEDLCRELEIHDDLGRLYDASFSFMR
jgi:hypothetical protein